MSVMMPNSAMLAAYNSIDDVALLAAKQTGVMPGRGGQGQQAKGKGAASAPAADPWEAIEKYNGYIGMAGFGAMGLPFVGAGLNKVGGWTGFSALNSLGNGFKKAGEMTFAEVGHATGLGGVFSPIGKAFDGVTSLSARALQATGLTKVASNMHAGRFQSHMGKVHAALGALGNVTDAKLAGHISEITTHLNGPISHGTFEKVEKALADATTHAAEVGHPAAKQIGKLTSAVEKAATSHYFADGYAHLGEYAKKSSSRIAQGGALHGLMNASFIAGAGITDYRMTTDLMKSLKNLKTMHAKLSGQSEDDISTLGLFLGKVSEPVEQARTEILKEFGPSIVLNAMNTVVNIKLAANQKSGGLIMMMALPMLESMVARGFLGGKLLPTYNKMQDMQCAGEEVPAEMYATLIGSASKELRERGGADSNFAKALSVFYAEHHAKADTVLREVHDGTIKKRVKQLQQEHDAYVKEHPEVAQSEAAEKAKNTVSKNESFVDRIAGKGKEMTRNIVGDHTAKLATQHSAVHTQGMA